MDGGYVPADHPRAPGHSPDWRPRDPVRGTAPVPAGPPPDAERGRGDRREIATEPQPGEPLLVGIDPANAKARGAGESGEDPADQANRLASGRRLAVADLFFRLLVRPQLSHFVLRVEDDVRVQRVARRIVLVIGLGLIEGL